MESVPHAIWSLSVDIQQELSDLGVDHTDIQELRLPEL